MTKADAIALLKSWTAALEAAQKVLAEHEGERQYDHYRPEASAWLFLAGWLNLGNQFPDAVPGLLYRTKAALDPPKKKTTAAVNCNECGRFMVETGADVGPDSATRWYRCEGCGYDAVITSPRVLEPASTPGPA